MSSSTVSITANPSAASLRRPIVTGEKQSGLDLAGSDGIGASPASGGENSRGKDLSHSNRTRTETVHERSRDAVPLPTNSTTKIRKRTVVKKGSVPSSSRPPWKTALRVIMKNFALLLVLLLLAQMIRKLAFDQGSGYDSLLIPSSDYERRIAEVEAFLKTTTKMMQVQVEVVDRKIENEIAGLKTELNHRIDVEGAEFSTRFSELDGRVESMEKSLAATEWLSKDEFDEFVKEFKEKKGVDDLGDMKLDEVRAFAREIVEKEIGKHAADGLGRVDYAVASGGAMVLKHSEAFLGASKVGSWFTGNVRSDAVKMLQPSFGQPGECFPLKGNNGFVEIKLRTAIVPEAITLEHVSKGWTLVHRKRSKRRVKMLQPSFGQPGECFPLKGNNGFVEIKLRTAIVPEAITLEHVSKSVAFDRSSAPKDCRVFGWLQNEEDTEMKHLLTEFTYDLEKSSAQTFNVQGSNPTIIDTIRLEFMSNHGGPTHTCIYRVRVHGHEPNVS